MRTIGSQAVIDATSTALGCASAPGVDRLVAASYRRAASLMCPSTPSELVRSVRHVLEPLVQLESDALVETLDSLVAAGDLVETTEERFGKRHRVIYLGHPRFVRRQSDGLLLFGTRPDNAPLVGDALQDRIIEVGYLRRIDEPDDEVFASLDAYGLYEIPECDWTGQPEAVPASEVIDAYFGELRQRTPSTAPDNLRLLDPEATQHYYRGRWRPADASDRGTFVARRRQRYGSDLWCLVDLQHDDQCRLLDLPIDSTGFLRGCDEAWRLQAAIDFTRGSPLELRVRGTGHGGVQLGLPIPPPKWLQRRWDLLGQPVRVPGTLFGYEFSAADARVEALFACEHLWMQLRTERKDVSE